MTASSKRNPARGAITYTAAALFSRGTTFLLLPLYTRALSPSEYGRLSVLVSIISFMTIMLGFGLESSTFRIYFEFADRPERQAALINTIWRFLAFAALIICPIIGVGSLLVLGTSTDTVINGPDMALAMAVVGTAVVAQSLPLTLLRAQERLKAYLIVMGVSAIGGAAASLTLVVVLHFGVPGMLAGTLIANTATFAVAMLLVPWRRRTKGEPELLRRSIRFGLPMLPHFLSMQALNTGDRLILLTLVSTASVGFYGLAANFGLVCLIACQSVTQATMPTYARVGTGGEDSNRLKTLIVQQISAVVLITVGSALVAPPLLRLVADKSYAEAASLVGWIILGYGFVGLYGVPMNGATMGAGRTGRAWIATLTGAIANVALIFALTPPLGIKGAAIASAGGYLVLLLAISVWAHIGANAATYDWGKIALTGALGIAIFIAGTITSPDSALPQLVVRSLWILPLIGGLALISNTHVGVSQLAAWVRSKRA